LDRMVQEFEQRLQMQGLTKEMYFQFSGQDEDALKEQMREDAEKRVKTNLTLEAIAKAEDIEATDDDVNEELENMASQYNMEVRSEEHTSELQSRFELVCRLVLVKRNLYK